MQTVARRKQETQFARIAGSLLTSPVRLGDNGWEPIRIKERSPLLQDIEQIKNTKKNVAHCFNVIKMNVADAVPRAVQHFLVEQLVQGLDRTLRVEDMVPHVTEKEETRDRRMRCRKKIEALEMALPLTDTVIQRLLTMRKVPA